MFEELFAFNWLLSAIIVFGLLIFLFAIGMPVGYALGFVTVSILLLTQGPTYVTHMMTSYAYTELSQFLFICFPLFILMTEIMAHGGISRRLVEIAHKVMGRFPGSLAAVAVMASAVFGAVSGAAAIGVITISDLLLPETMNRNYDKSLIAGAIAAGGTLSFIIPPSFMLILWGIISGESIERLFMGGVIPGIMITIMFVIYIVIKTKRNPDLAPLPLPTSTREKMVALVKGWDIALIIVVVIGGVYSGISTVTEIAGVAAFAALLIALAHRELNPKKMMIALGRTAELMAVFFIIILGAYFLIHLLGVLEIPRSVTEWVTSADLSATQLVIVVMVLFFILGMFIEAGSVMLIVLPLFLDSLNDLGVDLTWLGILVAMSCMIAELTPPVGFSLFVIQAVGRPHGINFEQIVRGVIPYIFMLIFAIALVIAVPEIATWLPSTMD